MGRNVRTYDISDPSDASIFAFELSSSCAEDWTILIRHIIYRSVYLRDGYALFPQDSVESQGLHKTNDCKVTVLPLLLSLEQVELLGKSC